MNPAEQKFSSARDAVKYSHSLRRHNAGKHSPGINSALCGYVPNYLLHVPLIFNLIQTGIFGEWRIQNNRRIVYFTPANVRHFNIARELVFVEVSPPSLFGIRAWFCWCFSACWACLSPVPNTTTKKNKNKATTLHWICTPCCASKPPGSCLTH